MCLAWGGVGKVFMILTIQSAPGRICAICANSRARRWGPKLVPRLRYEEMLEQSRRKTESILPSLFTPPPSGSFFGRGEWKHLLLNSNTINANPFAPSLDIPPPDKTLLPWGLCSLVLLCPPSTDLTGPGSGRGVPRPPSRALVCRSARRHRPSGRQCTTSPDPSRR